MVPNRYFLFLFYRYSKTFIFEIKTIGFRYPIIFISLTDIPTFDTSFSPSLTLHKKRKVSIIQDTLRVHLIHLSQTSEKIKFRVVQGGIFSEKLMRDLTSCPDFRVLSSDIIIQTLLIFSNLRGFKKKFTL